MSHGRLVSLVFFIGLLFSSIGLAAECAIPPLVADDLLQRAGLTQVWQAKLAIKSCEQVEKLTLLGDKVYALTSTNYLYCLDRNSGAPVFGIQLGPVGFPVLEPRAYGKDLLIVAGNKLIEIDPARGMPIYEMQFPFTVVCPVVRNGEYLYAAGADKRLHAIVAEDKAQQFAAAANTDSMITGVLISNGYLVFTTAEGNIICMSAFGPDIRWQYDTMGAITAAPVSDGNEVYVAGGDTKLYKFNDVTGKLAWKYPCGGVLKDSPRVTHSAVYQHVDDKGVTSVDKQTGLPLWTVDDGVELLAEYDGKAYIMTAGRTVTVVDKTSGKQVFSINFAQACLQAANTADGKMYIADTAGRLACIAAK